MSDEPNWSELAKTYQMGSGSISITLPKLECTCPPADNLHSPGCPCYIPAGAIKAYEQKFQDHLDRMILSSAGLLFLWPPPIPPQQFPNPDVLRMSEATIRRILGD